MIPLNTPISDLLGKGSIAGLNTDGGPARCEKAMNHAGHTCVQAVQNEVSQGMDKLATEVGIDKELQNILSPVVAVTKLGMPTR